MENFKERIEAYRLYLELIHKRMIDKYFEEQAPYLFCKEGCSHCCERGQFPVSNIEMEYIMIKFAHLDNDKRKKILENIQELIKEKQENNISTEDYFYKCPFLLDNKCSVYDNRALICRTHGLMFFIEDNKDGEKIKIPFCVHLNLNYSNVFDKEQNMITDELVEKVGAKIPPQAYNLSLKVLTNKDVTTKLGFEFGEIKPLIEWFM